jgi:DNA polymerase I-like protein with 3'-5' exonuclease and polymerase domains
MKRLTPLFPPGLLALFRNIEMPLLVCVADAEFNGLRVHGEFFNRLRNDLKERQRVLEDFFALFGGKSFNADSHRDVDKIKQRLVSALEAAHPHVEGEGEGGDAAKERRRMLEKLVLAHHPFLRIVSEWRSIARMPAVCTSILRGRHFERVKPVYNTLGTDTGAASSSSSSSSSSSLPRLLQGESSSPLLLCNK